MIIQALVFLVFGFMLAPLGGSCFKSWIYYTSEKQMWFDRFVGSLLFVLAMVCFIVATQLYTHGGK